MMAADDEAPRYEGISPLAAWPTVGMQVERLAADLDAHRALAAAGDRLARGAVLAAAHAALQLAVTPIAAEAERQLRHGALNAAVPVLSAAGLSHIEDLVRAALLYDVDPVSLVYGSELSQ